MEIKGRLLSANNDVLTGKVHITFAVDKYALSSIESLKDIDLRIIAKKWCDSRSKDANAYFHVLVGKLADTLNISKIACKNMMIARYGQPDYLPNQTPIVIKTNIPPEQMIEQEFLHTNPCRSEIQNGEEIVFYKVYRASHTLDSKEFSILLNGVVEECKEQGIETIPPRELEELLKKWQPRNQY